MITKEQYLEIINAFEKYTKLYSKVFNKSMSKDFQEGLLRGLDLIEPLVQK